MKALVIINRVGQIVILAIAFMACVGWNQAAGLQNNISSISRKRIKDIVRIRYVLPYRNLHTVPQPCSVDTAFDSENSTEKLSKRNIQSCKGVQSLIAKEQFESESASFAGPVFFRSKLDIADVFQGRGYFSGFVSSSAPARFINYYASQRDVDDYASVDSMAETTSL